jgi:hypothetical protein
MSAIDPYHVIARTPLVGVSVVSPYYLLTGAIQTDFALLAGVMSPLADSHSRGLSAGRRSRSKGRLEGKSCFSMNRFGSGEKVTLNEWREIFAPKGRY